MRCRMGILKSDYVYVQLAQCSFDVHLQEIAGTFVIGGTSVMLRPQGNMDMDYLFNVLERKNVTFITSVPSFLNNLIDHLTKSDIKRLKCLTTFDLGGNCIALVFYK